MLLVEYSTRELILYNYRLNQLLKINHNKTECNVILTTTDAFNRSRNVTIEVSSLKSVKIKTPLIFGCFLCIAGLASVTAVAIIYAMKAKAKQKHDASGHEKRTTNRRASGYSDGRSSFTEERKK
eukprot:TRINITY_DN15020_c0_g1_i1.p1 TRINITY_DN15020_c0_g1~~TRINITY_DN15020_c0_g1_i1.p1  ORF type:complete len:125 (+),score=22.88 TRINITY_DN15020_c0_g1_i1:1-375(+)